MIFLSVIKVTAAIKMRVKITATAFSTSAMAKLKNMAIGKVPVFSLMAPVVDFSNLTAKAMITVNWARTIPGTSKTNLKTLFSIATPRGVLKKTSRAAPRAMGEITMGRSRMVSTVSFQVLSSHQRSESLYSPPISALGANFLASSSVDI